MKNVAFFIVLAILTVGALVGWNAIRQRSYLQQDNISEQNINQTPTPEVGTAVGRNDNESLPFSQQATSSGSFGNTTKGGMTPGATMSASIAPGLNVVPTTQVSAPSPVALMNVVTYTDNGFNPKTLAVKNGTMVKFINQSSHRLWIESGDVSGGQRLDRFNMEISVGRDGFYEFKFMSNGTWGYSNKMNQQQQASVVVTN